MSSVALTSLAVALRVFDHVARYLESRNIRIADLEARRVASGGSLTLQDLDAIEGVTYGAIEAIPELSPLPEQ